MSRIATNPKQKERKEGRKRESSWYATAWVCALYCTWLIHSSKPFGPIFFSPGSHQAQVRLKLGPVWVCNGERLEVNCIGTYIIIEMTPQWVSNIFTMQVHVGAYHPHRCSLLPNNWATSAGDFGSMQQLATVVWFLIKDTLYLPPFWLDCLHANGAQLSHCCCTRCNAPDISE